MLQVWEASKVAPLLPISADKKKFNAVWRGVVAAIPPCVSFVEWHVARQLHECLSPQRFESVIGVCRELEFVALSTARDDTQEARALLEKVASRCPHLRALFIGSKYKHKFPNVGAACISRLARSCPKVTHITAYDLNNWTDDEAIAVARGWPALRHLEIWPDTLPGNQPCQFTDRMLEALGQHCPRLQMFSTKRVEMTADGVTALVRGCRRLSELKLMHSCLDDDMLHAIGKWLRPSLKLLNLISANHGRLISDAGLRSIALCPRLTNLSIDRTVITDAGVAAVIKGCPQLETLTLVACHGVTGRGLRGAKRLSRVAIDYCNVFNDEGLKALAAVSPPLSILSVEYCNGITDRGLDIVRRRSGGKTSIRVKGCEYVTKY